nr:MAG TPA: hypothetical protein [Caudoviricetes sp.]
MVCCYTRFFLVILLRQYTLPSRLHITEYADSLQE